VPFLVSWPERLPKGSVYEEPVMHIDFLPTVLAAAGLDQPEEVDGVDLLPYLTGERSGPPHEVLYFGDPRRDQYVVRRGKWKLIRESPERNSPRETALYDLQADVGETRNLIKQEADLANELMKLKDGWSQDVQRSFDAAW
jgi:arylsulfatase A-like enzyme